MNNKRTATVNGFRWEMLESTSGGFTAYPQKRCLLDNGKPYFRNCNPKARFDTWESMESFVANFPASEWACACSTEVA